MKWTEKGFTLIELLIVVAIIAILAAIAVPNFLEAQMRAKVSRAKSDMRSISVGQESYCIDNRVYTPTTLKKPGYPGLTWMQRLSPLSTPIAYITSVPQDPFQIMAIQKSFGADPLAIYAYDNDYMEPTGGAWVSMLDKNHRFKYDIRSYGPDLDYDDYNWTGAVGMAGIRNYDPTNGTVSNGEISYFGPGGGFGMNEMGSNY